LDERKLHAGGAPHLDLDEKDNVKTLVDQGLRAQLGTISYVTGLRYVALDFVPGSPAELVDDPTVPYPEIPTLPGELEGAQRELVAVLGKLAELDYGKLFRSVDATLVSAQKAFATLDSLLADLDELARLPDVRQAAANLREATGDLKGA